MSLTQKANIRILPTSKKTKCFETLQKTYLFYKKTLKRQDGYYKFKTRGLNSPAQSIILFQYCGLIVASAILLEDSNSLRKSAYSSNPAMRIDVDSIITFTPPISYEELKSICPTINPFSNTKQIIDSYYIDILKKFIKSRKD